MNNEKFKAAFADIDDDIICEAAEVKKMGGRVKFAKWGAIAAAFLAVVCIAFPTLSNLKGYQTGDEIEEDIFNRTNTYFESYEEMEAVVGETLLENVKGEEGDRVTYRVVHELDDLQSYKSMSAGLVTSDGDQFAVSAHTFKLENNYDGYEECEINGVRVLYHDSSDGTKQNYLFYVDFEYGGLYYHIYALGNRDVSFFWNNLNMLLGAK